MADVALIDQLNRKIEEIVVLEREIEELKEGLKDYLHFIDDSASLDKYSSIENYPIAVLRGITTKIKKEKERKQFKDDVTTIVKEVLGNTPFAASCMSCGKQFKIK